MKWPINQKKYYFQITMGSLQNREAGGYLANVINSYFIVEYIGSNKIKYNSSRKYSALLLPTERN